MPMRALLLLMMLGAVTAQEPATPPAEQPTGELTPPAVWPPADSSGNYYGNSYGSLFGAKPYDDTPFVAGPEPSSIFSPGRRQDKLQFSGFADLGFTLRSVSGSGDTFSQDQFGRDKLFNQNTSLLVTGPIWKALNLNVHAQVEQRSFGFNDTKPVWRVFWEDQNTKVTFGDIQPQIGDTNEFVPFSRRLTGLEARGRLGSKFEYLAFGSQVGGSIRTETFIGDGTPGPYFLTFVPIVDGSAVVVLDGIIQQPGFGETGDYTLNPSTGELLFNGATIIAPTSRIEVRYETLSGGGSSDWLLGGQFRWSPAGRFRMGLQYITQLAGGGGLDGPTERRVTDQFAVPTPSSGPFSVRPRPIVPGSETVQVNGILQERDVDYEIAYETGELRFFQILAEGTTITVRFSVIDAVDLGSGDRSIIGIDGSYSFGEFGAVQFAVAKSQGDAGAQSNPFSFTGTSGGYYGTSGNYGGTFTSDPFGTGNVLDTGGTFGGGGFTTGTTGGVFRSRLTNRPRRAMEDSVARGWDVLSRQTTTDQAARGGGGTAYKITANSRLGDFRFAGQLKSVSDNFSRIDSTGFFQNEKGVALQFQYSSGQRFSLSHRFDYNTRPFSTASTGDTEEVITSRVGSTVNITSLTWRPFSDSILSFTRNSQSNSGGGSSNELVRNAVTYTHRFGPSFSVNAGFEQAGSNTSGTNLTSGASASNKSDTTSGRFGLSYNSSGGKFGARFDYSFSNTSSSVAKNNASSIQGSLNYQPLKWLSMQLSHQLSDSHNESLVGRTFTRVPAVGTVEHLLYRLELQRRRQTGVGVFPDTGDTSVPTDPLTGGNINTSSIQDNTSQNTNLSILMPLSNRLSLSNTFTYSVTDNGRLAGSNSTGWQSNINYQLSDAINLGFGYSLQGLDYTDSGDSTSTGILNFNFDWRASERIDFRFDYQSLSTTNRLGDTTDAEDATTQGLDADSSFSSWGLDLRYQLSRRSGHSLFASLRNDSSSGGVSTSFSRFNFSTGMDFRLTSVLGLQLSYDFTNYKNSGETATGYSAHLINAGLGARF